VINDFVSNLTQLSSSTTFWEFKKEKVIMDIDSLTVGELKQISALAQGLNGGNCKPAKTLEAKRVVLVVDRGWIFAGDQSLTSDGYIKLTNAVHVFSWSELGFSKMVEDWKSKKVDLRKVNDVEIPVDAVIFRIPVGSDWGIK
jgi:hypothetical protein